MSSTRLATLLTALAIFAFVNADDQPPVTTDRTEPENDKIVVCYVPSWPGYWMGEGQFTVDHLRPELCTHLVYAFAGLNINDWTIRSLDPYKDLQEGGRGNYRKMTDLKLKYEGLKVSLAIGGYSEGSGNYSLLAADPAKRKSFVSSVLTFLKTYNFDGLDLDWEFPAKHDRENFVLLVKELREAFEGKNYLLTAATSANTNTLREAYDIPELSKYLDYFHIMAYDYHGTWDRRILANAPLNAADGLSVVSTVSHFLQSNAPPEKVILGLPLYGRTFYLVNEISSTQSPMGQPCQDKGFSGKFSNEDGFMGYNEICMDLTDNPNDWRTGWDDGSTTPYVVSGLRVVVYDNPRSITEKVKYGLTMRLGGAMVWSINNDDFHGYCAKLNANSSNPSAAADYPLMKSINEALGRSFEIVTSPPRTTTKRPKRKKSSATSFGISLSLITLGVVALSCF